MFLGQKFTQRHFFDVVQGLSMQRDSDGTSSSELRVFVAEGSVMGRKLVARHLKKLGALARVVGTGYEAVEQAR